MFNRGQFNLATHWLFRFWTLFDRSPLCQAVCSCVQTHLLLDFQNFWIHTHTNHQYVVSNYIQASHYTQLHNPCVVSQIFTQHANHPMTSHSTNTKEFTDLSYLAWKHFHCGYLGCFLEPTVCLDFVACYGKPCYAGSQIICATSHIFDHIH